MIRKVLVAASAAALVSSPAWALPPHGKGHGPVENPGSGHRSAEGTDHAGVKGKGKGNQGTPTSPSAPSAPSASSSPSSPKGKGKGKGKGNEGTPPGPSAPSGSSTPSTPSTPTGKGKGKVPGEPHKCKVHNAGFVASGTMMEESALALDPTGGTYSGKLVVKVTHGNHHASADVGKAVKFTLTNARVRLDVPDVDNDGTVAFDDVMTGDRTMLKGKIPTVSHKCTMEGAPEPVIAKVTFHPARAASH
ncbi:MAG: hypothetical protein FWD42_03040 [Solirubrobacterales bacterium]|nr:hypothetical protein [Solirubrobacterales bacterium]